MARRRIAASVELLTRRNLGSLARAVRSHARVIDAGGERRREGGEEPEILQHAGTSSTRRARTSPQKPWTCTLVERVSGRTLSGAASTDQGPHRQISPMQ